MAEGFVLTREVEVPFEWDKLGSVAVLGVPGSGRICLTARIAKSLLESREMDYRIGVRDIGEWEDFDLSIDESKLLKKSDDESEEVSERQSLREINGLLEGRLRELKDNENTSFEPILLVVEDYFLEKGRDDDGRWSEEINENDRDALISLINKGRIVGVHVLFVSDLGNKEAEHISRFIGNHIYTYKDERTPKYVPELKLGEGFAFFPFIFEKGFVFKF